MKKIILALLFPLCFSSSFGQVSIDTISSKVFKGDRILRVSVPESYSSSKDKRYPLLLLLDGDYLFDPFNGTIKYGNYFNELPEMIIVGIEQNQIGQREADTRTDANTGLPAADGIKFFDFISTELIPALELKYRLGPFRVIAGHDITAGFMNLFLYKENPLFNAYISLSPEMGTEMEVRVPTRLAESKKPVFYYQAMADGDLKSSKELIQLLDSNIKLIRSENLYYRFDEFQGTSHYSMVAYAIPNAMFHLFSAYQPISLTEFQEKIATLPGDYTSYLTKKYEIIEKYYGMKMSMRYTDIKAIEAAILKNKAYKELETLAGITKKQYPKSILPQYHMGLYYEKTGDIKKAIKAYQTAYALEEIGDLTKQAMLERADALKYSGN
jgi:predicted alpha/beta superfamily hydrolase